MIKNKLLILLDNNVIEKPIYDALLTILIYLLNKKIINDEQRSDFFLTHLAMACTRHNKGAPINFLDDDLKKEIIESENYPKSQRLWAKLQEILPLEFPESEMAYIHLHLINFLNAR